MDEYIIYFKCVQYASGHSTIVQSNSDTNCVEIVDLIHVFVDNVNEQQL